MGPALSSPASAATEGPGELAAHQTVGLAGAECPGLLLSQVPLQMRGTALGGHPNPGWVTPPGSHALILSRGPSGQRQSQEAWPQGLFPKQPPCGTPAGGSIAGHLAGLTCSLCS